MALVREPLGDGRTVWRPRLRFRTKPLRQCRFLINDLGEGTYRGLCSLHPHDKPLVCALSPLSREVDDPGFGTAAETWSFVPPVEGCPGVGLGPRLEMAAPAPLKERLAAEVIWMRALVQASEFLHDEESAWAWLDAQEAAG